MLATSNIRLQPVERCPVIDCSKSRRRRAASIYGTRALSIVDAPRGLWIMRTFAELFYEPDAKKGNGKVDESANLIPRDIHRDVGDE